MKIKLILITLTGILLFSFSRAKAQTVEPTFKASHLQAAENYLIATGISTKFTALTDNIVNTFSNQMPENNRAAFAGVMQKFMHKYYTWDTLKGDLSRMYAAEFTQDELQQLTAFFNTPLGQKYGDKQVALTQKGMLLGQKVLKDHQGELEEMMKEAAPAKN
jgi:uncharacterized protein